MILCEQSMLLTLLFTSLDLLVYSITIDTTIFVYLLITYIYLLHYMFRHLIGHHQVWFLYNIMLISCYVGYIGTRSVCF
jgi:hypothetical protein